MKNAILSVACLVIFYTGYAKTPFSTYKTAQTHPLLFEGPTPDFFEGALIGNGGLGAVVCARPDAIAIRFGHNNVWDIRIAEDNLDKIGTFRDVFEKINKIDPSLKSLTEDSWYRQYLAMCHENYDNPCGNEINISSNGKTKKVSGEIIEVKTDPGEILEIHP